MSIRVEIPRGCWGKWQIHYIYHKGLHYTACCSWRL